MRGTMIAGLIAWTSLAALGDARAWANSPPVVSNITVSQRTDGSKLVDIYYDLADDDACTVSVAASDDGGAAWTVPITAVSGHIRSGITPGAGKHIVWNSATDLPGAYGTNFKVRVCAVAGPGSMVLIPAGEYLMGDPFDEGWWAELPRHPVYVDDFCMDRYEVTNQQYTDALNWALSQGNLITVTGGTVYKYDSGRT